MCNLGAGLEQRYGGCEIFQKDFFDQVGWGGGFGQSALGRDKVFL